MTETTAPRNTIGKIVDDMLEIREAKRVLDKQSKELSEQYGTLEKELLEKLNEQDTRQAQSDNATAWVSEQTIPHLKSWDDLVDYIKENNAFHLLERRPATGAFRELLDQGIEIPGLEPFKRFTISLRKR